MVAGSLAAPAATGRSAPLRLAWRPFQFRLPRALVTAHGAVARRRGWLLRLEDDRGAVGWGEAAPLERQESAATPDASGTGQEGCAAAIAALGPCRQRAELEQRIPALPPELAFAIGLALAECDGLGAAASGGWRPAPAAAELLPAGGAALPALEAILAAAAAAPPLAAAAWPLTLKWKVAAGDDALERRLLEQLLERLPPGARLRLDANGGWDRPTAWAWAERLRHDPRLEWLEQPLAPADQEGLEALAAQLPVALDESLRLRPQLQASWPGWQVRRPALEGDPRPLLAALAAGRPRLMVSTAFETGVGRRLLEHLAALQAAGPTPTAPGLAPGWRPAGPLFSREPAQVWEALA